MKDYGPVNYLGGTMYGDGEYVVEFHRSTIAPLSATMLTPTGVYRMQFPASAAPEPNVQTARKLIATARNLSNGKGN